MWHLNRHLNRSLPNRTTPSNLLKSLLYVVPLVALISTVPSALSQVVFPPGNGTAPQRTAGAGVRGTPACIETHPDPTLVALVPNDDVSLTAIAQPEFFVYIPPNTAHKGIFSLSLSEDGYGGYTQTINLSGEPGVIKVSLPKEVDLETDKEYSWKFTLECGANFGSSLQDNNVTVQGKVKRIELEPELANAIEQAEGSLAQVEAYAQAGIWHEATSILYSLRDRDSQRWTTWLSSVQLQDLSSQASIISGSPTLF